MNEMKDLTEFAICSDIAARIAMFALAKACNEEEINLAFKVINEALCEGGEREKVEPIIEAYKSGALKIKQGLG